MTKQVALADDAYELLSTFRRRDESFSDIVRRLCEDERKRVLRSLAGVWKPYDEEAKRMTEEIYAQRKHKARGSET